jgi:anthranilate 1,2-dioxygenase small subunit
VVRTMEHDGAQIIFSTGQCRDEVVFDGATPLFRRRHVLFDSKAIDTLLAYPL